MLIAGEASGDVLAAELVDALRRQSSERPFPRSFLGPAANGWPRPGSIWLST